jgi:hypothetical protein
MTFHGVPLLDLSDGIDIDDSDLPIDPLLDDPATPHTNTLLINPLDAYISKERLVALTGVKDLKEVDQLEIIVNTTNSTLGDLGSLLPALQVRKWLKKNRLFKFFY